MRIFLTGFASFWSAKLNSENVQRFQKTSRLSWTDTVLPMIITMWLWKSVRKELQLIKLFDILIFQNLWISFNHNVVFCWILNPINYCSIETASIIIRYFLVERRSCCIHCLRNTSMPRRFPYMTWQHWASVSEHFDSDLFQLAYLSKRLYSS